jgi:hypothetical protein
LATLNVGAMAARLGLDPSEFLDKMKNVEGFTSGLNQRMSAEMKRTSREGAESFRLIDEALGIHVSRPLTRILTQEFPGFAKGLQAVMGVGVVGALGAVGFEFAEHIGRSIDEAKKKQEAYDEAIRHTEDVLGELGATHARTMEEIALRMETLAGKPGAKLNEETFKMDTSALSEAKKGIDEIAEATEKEARAAAAAAGWYEKLMLLVGYAKDNFWDSTSAQADAVGAKFQGFKHTLDLIMDAHGADPMQGIRDSLRSLDSELSTTGAEIARKLAAIQSAAQTVILTPGPHGSQIAMHPNSGVDADALAGQQRYFEMLKQQQKQIQEVLAQSAGHKDVAAKENALALAKQDAEKAKQAIRELQDELKGWNEENNRAVAAWMKLNEEIDKSVAKLDSEAFSKKSPRATFESIMPTPAVAPPPGAPQLPDQAELAKVTSDQNEAWRKAGEILAQIETPAQKYATGLATIQELQAEGRLSAAQTAQAAQLLGDEMVKAADHVHKMQEELLKLLERSDSASDGMRAFFLQLQIDGAENGKFAFSFLTKAFSDVEDGIAKTILATRNEHEQLKRMWEGYFKSLEEMALKFAMEKSMASLLNLASPNAGGANANGSSQEQAQGNKMAGWKSILEKVLGLGIATAVGGPAGLAQASQMFFAAGGGAGSGPQGAPVTSASLPDSIPYFAGGGDAAPGSSFISGEAGAEEVNLDSRGGAHVTPLGMKSGGDTNHYYDMRNSVVTDDLLRKADAARMMHATSEQSVARAVSMSTEIAKRSRPTR